MRRRGGRWSFSRGFEVAEGDEEGVGGGEGFVVVTVVGSLRVVEEAVVLALVADKFAAVAGGLAEAVVGFGGGIGDGGVGLAVENDGGWRAGREVVRRGEGGAFSTEALGGQVGTEAGEAFEVAE